MEHNREPKIKPAHTWTINLRQRTQEHTVNKGQSLQEMVLRILDNHVQKNDKLDHSYTTHKNSVKMN